MTDAQMYPTDPPPKAVAKHQAAFKAAMDAEEARTREAYIAQPDSEAEADDWSTAEEFRAPEMLQRSPHR